MTIKRLSCNTLRRTQQLGIGDRPWPRSHPMVLRPLFGKKLCLEKLSMLSEHKAKWQELKSKLCLSYMNNMRSIKRNLIRGICRKIGGWWSHAKSRGIDWAYSAILDRGLDQCALIGRWFSNVMSLRILPLSTLKSYGLSKDPISSPTLIAWEWNFLKWRSGSSKETTFFATRPKQLTFLATSQKVS